MTTPQLARSTARREVELKACFRDPLLDVMNFLNEVVLQFPAALSFAPGRPLESFFHVDEHVAAIASYVADTARRTDRVPSSVWQDIGQYGRTNGIVTDLIAAHLRIDEGIHVDPDAIMVTVGAQEAMAVLLAGLFEPQHDVLLVSDPTYIGITGLARVLGIPVVPVAAHDDGLDPDEVEDAIVRTSRGARVRALYDIPDFNNPLGTSLRERDRRRLLDVCLRHDVLLFEDSAYRMFAYDGERCRTMKSLDDRGVVVLIGSFSKTLFPGLRVGYLVADQRVAPDGEPLAKALSRVKSLLTVNTPPLLQAVVAAVLLRTGGSLEPVMAPKRAKYKRQRDAMLDALAGTFADLAGLVTWSRPAGGFFLTVTLPFEFGPVELRRCAEVYGVIVCPMRFFCIGSDRRRQVRLSFSCVEPEQIVDGIARLGRFVRAELALAPFTAAGTDQRGDTDGELF